MNEFTVLVEVGSADGDEWQELAPPEITLGDSATEVARWTATNQDVAQGNWRVRVWDGGHADTRRDGCAGGRERRA